MPAITFRGIKINYLESGKGLHNAVFLHGNLQSSAMWNDFIAGMPEEFRCLAFDFRGFGGSPATAHGIFVDSLADDIRYALHALELERCSLLAFGEGARVAQSLAARYPSLIYKLILIGGDALPADPAVAGARVEELEGLTWKDESLARILKADCGVPRNRKVPEDLLTAATAADQSAAVALARSVATGSTLALLPHITARTLIIRGEKDAIAGSAEAAQLQSQISGAQSVELPGANRLPALGDVDAYREAALKLLQAM
ncbi:MAG: alpha/beta hydrolase [Chloroflexota bacterium]|jgi:pimeloyl-ACP methyl ester carboxylesterase|nr:alpha/beta hydrolase [Chloroflexota bacterium]MDP6509248.1 alpha/beta hydrolase [Chloroflexota bacterium]MDP6758213.1 alpha/beta hydrolase [Chloroflexota bacterium]